MHNRYGGLVGRLYACMGTQRILCACTPSLRGDWHVSCRRIGLRAYKLQILANSSVIPRHALCASPHPGLASLLLCHPYIPSF